VNNAHRQTHDAKDETNNVKTPPRSVLGAKGVTCSNFRFATKDAGTKDGKEAGMKGAAALHAAHKRHNKWGRVSHNMRAQGNGLCDNDNELDMHCSVECKRSKRSRFILSSLASPECCSFDCSWQMAGDMFSVLRDKTGICGQSFDCVLCQLAIVQFCQQTVTARISFSFQRDKNEREEEERKAEVPKEEEHKEEEHKEEERKEEDNMSAAPDVAMMEEWEEDLGKSADAAAEEAIAHVIAGWWWES
jgi:hypothetical protein